MANSQTGYQSEKAQFVKGPIILMAHMCNYYLALVRPGTLRKLVQSISIWVHQDAPTSFKHSTSIKYLKYLFYSFP